jgi:hypothetical protein
MLVLGLPLILPEISHRMAHLKFLTGWHNWDTEVGCMMPGALTNCFLAGWYNRKGGGGDNPG